MKETLESKRLQIKAKYDQLSSQIISLQDQQKTLLGGYLTLNELIEEEEKANKPEEHQ